MPKSSYLTQLQLGMSPSERFNQIIEQGMCIGCGICQSICDPGQLKMKKVTSGYFRPIVESPLSHEQVDRIMDICPRTRVDGLTEEQINIAAADDDVWGWVADCYFSHAKDPEIRHMASTGGVLTALALYLIESSEVDFILHAREPRDEPIFGEACISRTRQDVLNASGSRYGQTATLETICDQLEHCERSSETFGFIGTPCDISALRNLARHDSRVDRYCRYMLTMVCGGFMEPASFKHCLAEINIDSDQIASLRYRGYGCPGPTTIITHQGKKVSKNYLEFWGEDDSGWQLPPRCIVCPDGIGDSADIAASDTWEGGAPNWEDQKTDLGTNAVILRTKRGLELMQAAEKAGYLVKGDQLTTADMNRFQPHQEAKKRAVWARFLGMKQANSLVPDTRGLRLERLYQQNTPEDNERETQGAKRRAESGRFCEIKPIPVSS